MKPRLKLKKNFYNKIIINGEIKFDHARKRLTTVEIGDNFISIIVEHIDPAKINKSEIHSYTLNKKDRSIHFGTKGIEEQVVRPGHNAYVSIINSMKSYLGDIFLKKPSNERIQNAVSKISNRGTTSLDIFLKLLVKSWQN